MLHVLADVVVVGAVLFLLSKQASMAVWSISVALFACFAMQFGFYGMGGQIALVLILWLTVFCAITPLRKRLISRYILPIVRRSLPTMSATEREALEAGTVTWEGDLFSGSPDFDVLRSSPKVALTVEEQAFMDGPVNVLCRMLDDWDITHNRTDLSPEVWTFIKEQGFLGMIIPKCYGGLEFSATAQMSVLVRLYGRSITAATTISVPNSLGPAELLLKYGTDEQKNHYLPRLANGRDIPCFALTGPNAGSDAASIPDKGVVCHQTIQGKEVLGIRLTWDKRYITLCPVATIIGLAFRLFDPENLLGKGHDVGICCALIPAETPGVIKGRRHFPLNTAFMNGPTQGKDVFVPIDSLIGGPAMAGHGWRMLMECLSAGRAISLPSSASGGVQACALVTGAYARIRKQFHMPIAQFEGIEEPLARIAGNAYILDAALTMTVASIDKGAKPSVAGAILKYHTTERSRQVACDAMDIHGGKGICLGPNNYLGRGFQGSAIGITVEGANILSRSLIIFGQGAIRCHPFIFREMESVRKYDLTAFDQAVWGHVGFVLANLTQSLVFGWTDARMSKAPASVVKRYYQLIHRYSSHLALLADFSMITLGGQLKRKENISARLGDILSYLYLASAVLQKFYQDGETADDKPLVDWCCQHLLHECEVAISGVIANFPLRWARTPLRLVLRPLGQQRHKPSDNLGKKLAKILTTPSETRTRLTHLVFHEPLKNCPLGIVESAFNQLCAVEALEKKVVTAVKEGLLKSLTLLEQIEEAKQLNVLNSTEAHALKDAELARQQVIAVDDFNDKELRRELSLTEVLEDIY
ncbi:acyl-CoA dehydrogenase [bacterium]|nr:acyl-CoA dehydrogenase [bacterium]